MGQMNSNGCVLTRYGSYTEINATQALKDAEESSKVYPHTVYWLVKAIFENAPITFKKEFEKIKLTTTHTNNETILYRMVYPVSDVDSEIYEEIETEVEVNVPEYSQKMSLFAVRDLVEKYESSWIKLTVITSSKFYVELLKYTIECIKLYHHFVVCDLPWKAMIHSDMNKHVDFIELLYKNKIDGIEFPKQIEEIYPLFEEAQKIIEGDRYLKCIKSEKSRQTISVVFVKEKWSVQEDYITLIINCIDKIKNSQKEEPVKIETLKELNDAEKCDTSDNEKSIEDNINNITSDHSERSTQSESESESEENTEEERINQSIESKLNEIWDKCMKIIDSISNPIHEMDDEQCSYERTHSTYRWY